MKKKPFNEDTGIEYSEPIPNNFFLILSACILVILVGIATWSTLAAIITALIEIFIWTWYKLIFTFKNKTKNEKH